MNLKVILLVIAIIGVGALGAVFSLGKYNFDQKSKLNADSTQNSNEGKVAGATNISGDSYVADLAKALTSKGVSMYCSSQSSDCNNQKTLFGDAAQDLDYVECNSSVSNANMDECVGQNIQIYPTWVYQGKQYVGIQSLSDLAKMINFSE
jgi:type II secretory pathway pseudopilin PulG